MRSGFGGGMPDPGIVAVCFVCRRRIAAREVGIREACPDCGGPLQRVSARLPLPPRDNVRGWDALAEVCYAD